MTMSSSGRSPGYSGCSQLYSLIPVLTHHPRSHTKLAHIVSVKSILNPYCFLKSGLVLLTTLFLHLLRHPCTLPVPHVCFESDAIVIFLSLIILLTYSFHSCPLVLVSSCLLVTVYTQVTSVSIYKVLYSFLYL